MVGSYGRVLKVEWWYCQTDFFVYLLCRRMNSADRNDLMPAPAQEKLEWVTPKISLMDAGNTEIPKPDVPFEICGGNNTCLGPS